MLRLLHTFARNSRAAIDLASIMVGVLIVGIITAVALPVVFSAVPWAQDQATKQNLNTVAIAEAAHQSQYSGYGELKVLRAAQLMPDRKDVFVQANPAGTCWVGATQSPTGSVFWRSNASDTIGEYRDGKPIPDTSSCVAFTVMLAGLADVANGGDGSVAVTPPPTPLTTPAKLAAAEAAYFTANGSYSNSLPALDTAYGKPVLSSGEAAKVLLSPDPDYSNLVTDGSFETDTTGATRFPAVTGATFARVTAADAPEGGSYIRATQTTGGSLQVTTKSAYLDGAGAYTIPAVAGKRYTLSLMGRASFATNLRVQVQFYNAAGTALSTAVTTGTDITSAVGTWARMGGSLASDSPTNTASMRVMVGSVNWGGVGTTIDIDAVTVNIGYHVDVISGSKVFYLPTYFTTRKQGWLAVIRNTDGSTDYLSSENTTAQQFFPKTADVWAAPSGGTVVVSGTTLFPVNLTPWAGAIGLGIGSTTDQTKWFEFKNQAWTIKP